MQYLLTQEEYEALVTAKREREEKDRKKLQDFCTMVANELPVKGYGGEIRPWKCLLTEEDEHYCDLCPSQKVCPHESKEWSQ